MKRLLLIAFLSFPTSGKEFPVQHPPDTIRHRFELPLSAHDATNEIPNPDIAIALKPAFRLPTIYRTEATIPERNSSNGFSFYTNKDPKEVPPPSEATIRRIEWMQGKYQSIIAAAAKMFPSATEERIYAVMWVECKGKIDCVSSAGAEGPMQINPITQDELGLKPGEAFIPKKAIPGAAEYLETNYAKFGNWPATLLAYNIGPNGAEKYLRKGKDPSRHPYVKEVLKAQSLM